LLKFKIDSFNEEIKSSKYLIPKHKNKFENPQRTKGDVVEKKL